MESIRELDRYLQAVVEQNQIPGVVAMAANKDQLLYQAHFGQISVAEQIEMTPDAIFAIMSMTKPITSVAIMILYEAGRLKLDDPVSRYLPALAQPQVVSQFSEAETAYTTQPAQNAITIHHLLTHTAGFGYNFSNRMWNRMEQLARHARQSSGDLPLLHEPGQRWTYSKSTRILGEVVEAITGETLDQFLRAAIFEPLQMFDTHFIIPPEKRDRWVTMHQREKGTLSEQPHPEHFSSTFAGDGGLYSTAPDYIKFLQMLLNGGTLHGQQILRPDSIDLMIQNQIGPLVVENQVSVIPSLARDFPLGAGKDKFGLGFQITAEPAEPGMRSAGSYSWCGLYNSYFWADPQHELAAVILMQVLPFYDETCLDIYQTFEALLYRNLIV